MKLRNSNCRRTFTGFGTFQIPELLGKVPLLISSFQLFQKIIRTSAASEKAKLKSLETCQAQKIDLILTDYCMPEMNGYDLLKIVKEQSCLMSIPVVIMSSENVPERISRCRSIGAEDFIMKPLKAKDVRMLRNYARPTVLTPKPGSKRKMPLDLLPESNSLERRTCLAGVVEHEYANCPPFSAYTLA